MKIKPTVVLRLFTLYDYFHAHLPSYFTLSTKDMSTNFDGLFCWPSLHRLPPYHIQQGGQGPGWPGGCCCTHCSAAVLQCCSGHVTRPQEVTGTSYQQPRSRTVPILWGPQPILLYYQYQYFISIIIGGAGTGPGVAPYRGWSVDQNIGIWQQISTAS